MGACGRPDAQRTSPLFVWAPGCPTAVLGTWGPGDLGTWGPGDLGTWGPGDLGTWGPGGMRAPGYPTAMDRERLIPREREWERGKEGEREYGGGEEGCDLFGRPDAQTNRGSGRRWRIHAPRARSASALRIDWSWSPPILILPLSERSCLHNAQALIGARANGGYATGIGTRRGGKGMAMSVDPVFWCAHILLGIQMPNTGGCPTLVGVCTPIRVRAYRRRHRRDRIRARPPERKTINSARPYGLAAHGRMRTVPCVSPCVRAQGKPRVSAARSRGGGGWGAPRPPPPPPPRDVLCEVIVARLVTDRSLLA